ncbi:hypothetical protein GGI07_000229 [Coemansia sp. Benny D115]|nr:hypothetical protein GGI07_000229 [Coemansia sp. Benny D115]
MNFFRRKVRREAVSDDAVSGVDSAKYSDDASKKQKLLQSAASTSDKIRRRSYFSMSVAAPSLLRQKPPTAAQPAVPQAVALVALSTDACSDMSMSVDLPPAHTKTSIATKLQRRRSIPVVAYLTSKRRSPKDVHAADQPAADAEKLAAGLALPGAHDSSTSEDNHSSNSRSSSSGDESSGGDSDVTLASAQEVPDLDATAPAELASQSPAGCIAAGQACVELQACSSSTAHVGDGSNSFRRSVAASMDIDCEPRLPSGSAIVIPKAYCIGAAADNAPADMPNVHCGEASADACVPLSTGTLCATEDEASAPPQPQPQPPSQASIATHNNRPQPRSVLKSITMPSSASASAMRGDLAPSGMAALLSPSLPFFMAAGSGQKLLRASSAPTMAANTTAVPGSTVNNVTTGTVGSRRTLGQPQRRPLSLGRWRTTTTTTSARDVPKHAPSITARLSLNLGIGHNNNDHSHCNSSSSSRRRLSLRRSPSSTTAQPKSAEQRKMEAWAADDDDFSIYDYDLTGAYFELPKFASAKPAMSLPVASSKAASQKATAAASAAASGSPSTGSRLSSTSTIVEDYTLNSEQCKHIYMLSMRKLQWQGGRLLGMRGVLHIKNAMAKASEHYVVVSGGRCLDAYQASRDMLADFYMLGGSNNTGSGGGGGGYGRRESERDMHPSLVRSRPFESSPSLPLGGAGGSRRRGGGDGGSVPKYPTRARSMNNLAQFQHLLRNPRPVVSVEVAAAAAGEQSSNGRGRHASRIVTAPMSSPPALGDGAAGIAGKALAMAFSGASERDGGATMPDSELLAFGSGDLVSLVPADAIEDGDALVMYRPQRRRRGGRRAGYGGAQLGMPSVSCADVFPVAISSL